MAKNLIQTIMRNFATQKICRIEPRLIPILEEAENQRNCAGYNRVATYIKLRNQTALLVGYNCEKLELQNSESYDLILGAIRDLLPRDNEDLGKQIKPKTENSEKISDTFSPKMRYQVLERDGFKCVKCGRSAADGVKLHADHIYPKSRGGMATLDNGQTLCDECNIGKGARVPETHPTKRAADLLTGSANLSSLAQSANR